VAEKDECHALEKLLLRAIHHIVLDYHLSDNDVECLAKGSRPLTIESYLALERRKVVYSALSAWWAAMRLRMLECQSWGELYISAYSGSCAVSIVPSGCCVPADLAREPWARSRASKSPFKLLEVAIGGIKPRSAKKRHPAC
jgi:hypothetical protein